jgi:Kef-type K+ transport system membrane component KefB
VESNVIELFLALGIIIAAAQLAGAAARALSQPRVFGELIAGVVLGPTVLNFLDWSIFHDPEMLHHTITELAELGVLFLMFTVGLEVHLGELLSVRKVAVWGGVLGAVLPILLGAPIILLYDYSTEAAIFVGVTVAATSVSISAQTLLELGVLRTKEGLGLLATAVVDDVLAILLLSITVATLGTGESAGALDLLWIFVRMMLFIVIGMGIAWTLLPRLLNRIHRSRNLATGTAAFALIAALIFGWAADALGGIAAITGAFMAGMGLSQTTESTKHVIEEAVQNISYSFLVPIFFVNVGLIVDLTELGTHLLPLTGLLLVSSIISKVLGSGVGARIGGFTTAESFRLGVCMISRGEVGLIIASVGLSSGFLNEELFQPVFVVILLTTVLTPPLVRLVFRERTQQPRQKLSSEQA